MHKMRFDWFFLCAMISKSSNSGLPAVWPLWTRRKLTAPSVFWAVHPSGWCGMGPSDLAGSNDFFLNVGQNISDSLKAEFRVCFGARDTYSMRFSGLSQDSWMDEIDVLFLKDRLLLVLPAGSSRLCAHVLPQPLTARVKSTLPEHLSELLRW